MKGNVSWQTGKDWIQDWLRMVDIPDFGLIGGEPTLNPDCRQWIYGVRDLMPTSQIRFTTNAVNFLKNTEVLDWCVDIGNCVFKFTLHQDSDDLAQAVDHVFSRHAWRPISEHGIDRWIGPNHTRFQINRPNRFVKTFRGDYGRMRPHDSDPARAFEICVQQQCPLLYEGKIYKCSSVALLNRVLDDWKQPIGQEWHPYTNHYRPISVDSDQSEIKQFIDNFGLAHDICRMCPTADDLSSIIDHKSSVIDKKKWIQMHLQKIR